MPTDSPSQSRRGGHYRGRRQERRSPERRPPQGAEQPARPEHLDVEQIMREIRARIAQRNGIELTDQQIQELAARRLESILDPRSVKPGLLDELRRSAGTPATTLPADKAFEAPYRFEDTTLYESHRGPMRIVRKLLNPILKLFFNPNPLIKALNTQARLNVEAAEREARRDRVQAEWNALHYELLQRVVVENARLSVEVQSLTLQMESLAARVDFNDRRVRALEGSALQGRPAHGGRDAAVHQREQQRQQPQAPPAAPVAAESQPAAAEGAAEAAVTEEKRRRRRRRRGRRGGAGAAAEAGGTAVGTPPEGGIGVEGEGEGPDEDLAETEPVTTEGEVLFGSEEPRPVAAHETATGSEAETEAPPAVAPSAHARSADTPPAEVHAAPPEPEREERLPPGPAPEPPPGSGSHEQ